MSNSQKRQAELDNIFIKQLNRQEVHKEEKDIDIELSVKLCWLDLLNIGHFIFMRFYGKNLIVIKPHTGLDDYIAIYFIVQIFPIQNIRSKGGTMVHKFNVLWC